jgi:hypothetical protein
MIKSKKILRPWLTPHSNGKLSFSMILGDDNLDKSEVLALHELNQSWEIEKLFFLGYEVNFSTFFIHWLSRRMQIWLYKDPKEVNIILEHYATVLLCYMLNDSELPLNVFKSGYGIYKLGNVVFMVYPVGFDPNSNGKFPEVGTNDIFEFKEIDLDQLMEFSVESAIYPVIIDWKIYFSMVGDWISNHSFEIQQGQLIIGDDSSLNRPPIGFFSKMKSFPFKG